jgi:predicted ATPase
VTPEYIFEHPLTQEVAYYSVLIERRTQLHELIGAALEALYASSLEDHLAELSNHYSRSGNLDKAIEYQKLAGERAYRPKQPGRGGGPPEARS